MKSDAEPAIIAFRNRVAEMYEAEVATEDVLKGDKQSNELFEHRVMLIRGVIRTIGCHIESSTEEALRDDSPTLPWCVENAGGILSRKPTQEFVPHGDKVLAKQNPTDPMHRKNPRYKFGILLGMRNNSAECLTGNVDGVFRAREIRRLEPQSRSDKETITKIIGVPWRMTDGRWTVDRPDFRVDPTPNPAIAI